MLLPAPRGRDERRNCDPIAYGDIPEAVSYTHLDVYKRQTPELGPSAGVPRTSVRWSSDNMEAESRRRSAAQSNATSAMVTKLRTCLLYTSRCV